MAAQDQIDVVTGAFSYSGAAIAAELRARGHRVRTLTGHPGRARAAPTSTSTPLTSLTRTGWSARYAAPAPCTTRTGYASPAARSAMRRPSPAAGCCSTPAARAGIRRIVHVSITHADPASRYPYFQGKAAVEAHLMSLGVPYAIARPAILFGGNGVLVNNIAWLLRRLPVFAIGGRGSYRVRAIHVEDLARLCADLGGRDDPVRLDAVGPQSLPFRDLVTAIRDAVGSHAAIVPVPGQLIPPLSSALGVLLRDVLLTRDEYLAMAEGLADSDAPATGHIAFTDWVAEHGQELGRAYASEISLHFRPGSAGEPAH